MLKRGNIYRLFNDYTKTFTQLSTCCPEEYHMTRLIKQSNINKSIFISNLEKEKYKNALQYCQLSASEQLTIKP